MSNESSPTNNRNVRVFIYEREIDFLKWLVLQKREIETGGDLFGLWRDDRTAVVQYILGPGEGCRRTTTSFHQDVTYLEEVGGFLTSSHGLCNIGEWHSHHTLGLAKPSHGDQQTVWNNITTVAGGRFLVFIANIRGTPAKVNIGCFLFNLSERRMIEGIIECLPCPSPVRFSVDNAYQKKSKPEPGQDWTTFMKYEQRMKKDNSAICPDSSVPSPREEESMSGECLHEERKDGDEDLLSIPTERADEHESSTCGKICKRMYTSARRLCCCCYKDDLGEENTALLSRENVRNHEFSTSRKIFKYLLPCFCCYRCRRCRCCCEDSA